MTHPNYMVAWDEIRCQRGHGTGHQFRTPPIHLGGPTPYHDYPEIPLWMTRDFSMMVWDPDIYPVDGGDYCPAHDAVSATIVSHGVWEVRETILTLQVLSSAEPGQRFVDFGAQIGWFSLLAASCGVPVVAIEADEDNAGLLKSNMALNDWRHLLSLWHTRVGPESEELTDMPTRLVKIDIEGAERQAIRMLQPSIQAGHVDHIMMEVSPVFCEGYPQLVCDLVDAGYRAYLLPHKQQPPLPMTDLPNDLERIDTLPDLYNTVGGWHQEDVWFARDGASW